MASAGRPPAASSRAGSERVTFDDVAGIDEAEQELVEIVDFLKNPERYTPARRPHSPRCAALWPAGDG